MRYDNQLRYAVNIVKQYDGRYPLSAWLKDFFKENKQMGSRDRKTVAELVYGYFRLGYNSFDNIEARILAGVRAGNHPKDFSDHFASVPAVEKDFQTDKIFPWKDQLSEGVDVDIFEASFLVQPDLFIRVRPGFEKAVTGKLNAAGILYSKGNDDCVAMANATRVDTILNLNYEAVVQDRSSQRTGELIRNIPFQKVWDCCAASGGKSIMAYDMRPNIDLTVSDIRESILANLRSRFRQAGIERYHSFTADISSPNVKLPGDLYDLIIADVPCTGSGTWARTPEELCFFKEEKIDHYADLQHRIVARASRSLKPGGHLLYITCSVFKKENEQQVDRILSDNNLRLLRRELIKGYTERADTMFAALFTNAPA